MADHHDDHLDSALDLLRSRQWAGPATNPVLEKQFMHPNQDSRGLNLRLVLGIAGALIGCGAVAAASRPAWRTAIFGAAPEAPKRVVIAAPAAATAPRTTVAVRRTPAPAPTPIAIQEPAAEPTIPSVVSAAAAQPQNESAPLIARGMQIEEDQTEWLRDADPECYYQQALAAYLDRYMAGDAQGCAAIASAVDGTNRNLAPLMVRDLARVLSLTTLDGSQGQFTSGVIRLNMALNSLGAISGQETADTVFEITLDGLADRADLVTSSEQVIRLNSNAGGGFVTVTGSVLQGGDGNAVWLFASPAEPARTAPATPAPRR